MDSFKHELALRKQAAKAEAERTRKPEVAVPIAAPPRAPKRSELIRAGKLSVTDAAVTRGARKRPQPISLAADAPKHKVKVLTPLQAATNPTRARFTGEKAKAVALEKRLFRAKRKADNLRRQKEKEKARTEAKTLLLKDANELAPEPTLTRFPPPGETRSRRWADDEDVPTDAFNAWITSHNFASQRSWSHTLHCSISGNKFWAEDRDQVVLETPELAPDRWAMVRGVYTYHGRLPGGAPVARPPPSHVSQTETLSDQLVCYVNLCARPISSQSIVTDGMIAWFLACPDTHLLCFYGPNTGPMEAYLRTRMLAACRGTRAASPVAHDLPAAPSDHTMAEVAQWAGKRTESSTPRFQDFLSPEYPIQVVVFVGSDQTMAWCKQLDDVVSMVDAIRRAGLPVTMNLETMTSVVVFIVPRLVGGAYPLHPMPMDDDDGFPAPSDAVLLVAGDEPVTVTVVTPYELRRVTLPSLWHADEYGRRLATNHLVYISIDLEGNIVYTITGRLIGGSGNKAKGGPERKQTKGKGSRRERENKLKAASLKASDEAARPDNPHGSSSSSERQTKSGWKPHLPVEDWEYAVEGESDDNAGASLSDIVDYAKTSATEARDALKQQIANKIISVKAHKAGEPDWNPHTSSWSLTFMHLGQTWFFDSRIEEHDRLSLMAHTLTLDSVQSVTMFAKYFFSSPDAHLYEQHDFGWGARNFREFGPGSGSFQITDPIEIPRPPTIRDYCYLFCETLDLSDMANVELAVRFVKGEATWEDMRVLGNWVDNHQGLSSTEVSATGACGRVRQRLIEVCAAANLGNPFIPTPPAIDPHELDPGTILPSVITQADRYATAVSYASMPLPAGARFLRHTGVRIHAAIRQFMNAYVDDLSEGNVKANALIDNYCTGRLPRALAKLALSGALLGVPLLTAASAVGWRTRTFSDLEPICGVRLYNTRVRKEISREAKLLANSFDPTVSTITMSEDQAWVDSTGSMQQKIDRHFVKARDCRPVAGTANPLYAVAALLTRSARRQIASGEVPDPLNPDTVDTRAQKSTVEKMLVRDCSIAAVGVASISTTRCGHTELLVCRELFSSIVANYKRYASLIKGPNPYQNISSAVLTSVMVSSVNYNIPLSSMDRPEIEHDTARAASIAIWSLNARDLAGDVPGPDSATTGSFLL